MRAVRCLLVAVAIVLLASTDIAQTAPQGGPSSPDLSGVWHRWFRPGLGPSASGPGPVTNRSRINGVSNYYELVGDYTNPILKPGAAEVVRKLGAQTLGGEG